VIVQLKSEDVIHSLWVPSLAGKKDLIPGRTAVMTFRADHPGLYRGQCAEFCGLQHAFMAFSVQADAPEQFEAWRRQQLSPPPAPTDAIALRGQGIFQSSSCAMCHAVAGTLAGAQHAPDLSHVASRQTLAAGTLPNTQAQMAAWITDPQKFKPGTNMPATPLSGDDLAALVTYLGTLK
jgi:cytochrome c oxidase subunit 2